MTGTTRDRSRGVRRGFAALLLVLPACMYIHGTYQGENPIDPDKVRAVVAGKTTRGELLAAFGPPEALVRKGDRGGDGAAPTPTPAVPAPPPPSPAPPPIPRGFGEPGAAGGGGGGEREGYLALFADRALTERHAVYFYSSTRLVSNSTLVLLVGDESRRVVRDRLWVLVDDGTGLVEAVAYRPGEAEAAQDPPRKEGP